MANRVSVAMEEAYASAPADVVIIHTLDLFHAAFGGNVRICMGDDGILGGETVNLTLETGATVPFTSMAFDVIPPGFDDDGPIPGKVRVDGVSPLLIPYLDAAVGAPGTIDVTYRVYRSDVRFEPGEVISGLKMKRVEVTATTVEAEIGFEEVGNQAFPRITYDISEYPALFLGS